MIALTLVLVPAASMAVGMQADYPALTVNSTTQTVFFAGQEWYVIGYNGSGVYSQSGTVTLLLKYNTNSSTPFGDIAFRNGRLTDPGGWTQYPIGTGYWYEGNFTAPSDYSDSTLQRFMTAITDDNTSPFYFPPRESALINLRSLTAASDHIGGADSNSQKLWPLSFDELRTTIDDVAVHSFGQWYWLRSSPPGSAPENAGLGNPNGTGQYSHIVYSSITHAVRPALNLNLSSVLFTSTASGTDGKSSMIVGGGLISASVPADAVKFTVQDTSLTLACTDRNMRTVQVGDTVSIAYSGAQTGANKYVSCVIVDSSNTVLFYGKLATAASGKATFTVPPLPNDSYTIKLFNEECNADSYTDFASTPISIGMTVGDIRPPSDLPKTGDGFPMGILLVFLGTALIGLGWLSFRARVWGAQK